MAKKHHLVFVPGLGGVTFGFTLVSRYWKRYGFIIHLHDMGWRDGDNTFVLKLKRLVLLIDTLHKDGDLVSLIGTSAGASAVLNAFYERKKSVHRVVNVCGRLKSGTGVYPTLDVASKTSPSFKESVLLFEKREPLFTIKERSKVLTMRALFDELVPTSTILLRGAKNIQLLSIEHVLSIVSALTIYNRPIREFLQ